MPSFIKTSSCVQKSLFFERVERNFNNKCSKRYSTFTNTQVTDIEIFKKGFHVVTKRFSSDFSPKSYKDNDVTNIKEIASEFKSQPNNIIKFYNITKKEGRITINKNLVSTLKQCYIDNIKQMANPVFYIEFSISYNYGLRSILILKYPDGGILKTYLQSNFDKLNWARKLDFAQQLADSIKFMHENEIIHGNLHSNNIFIYENNLKLLNFVQNMTHFQTEELYRVAKKSDIYSLGILMWEISKSRPPFKPTKEICQLSELTIDMLNDASIDFIEKAQTAYIALYSAR
ncbi:9038_t:CDS:2 [Cetraspora pellucida]|uniref:9038_t:CDS:1 n=1 Tax=Cetraspora pellucida TaxID=1433469 RepID=A0ACA9K8L8_9GLOM|nr:9038_t:CDS:2 [Cetraspora pellucida]